MASKAEKIKNRQKQLETKKVRWENINQDVARYIYPLFEDILNTKQSGDRQGSEMYDGTGLFSLNTLAKVLYGKVVNPASVWFKLTFRDEQLNELAEGKEWLQAVERHLYNVFRDSNFYDSIEMFLKDGASFGTAIMFIKEEIGEERLVYMLVPWSECYIEQNADGDTNLLHRKVDMTAMQIESFFGDDTPEIVKKSLEETPFKEFEVLNAVFPRELRDPTLVGNKNMPFESTWLIMGTSNQQQQGATDPGASGSVNGSFPQEIRESGFEDFPYVIWKWETNGKEEYGRSPGMMALADVMGLNLMERDLLSLSELIANPPMNVISGTEENVNFMPRGMNVINGPEEAPHATDIGGLGWPIGLEHITRKQEAVRKHFFIDKLAFLDNVDIGQATAFEIATREGENAIQLGSMLGKLGSSLQAMIDRTSDIEFEAGRMPEAPAALLEATDGKIDVIFNGPLAQAQRNFFESGGIDRGIEAVGVMAAADPNVLKVVDFPEATRIKLEALGFPQKAINTRQEVQAQIEQEQLLQAQAQQTAQAQAEASAMKDLAKADKDSGGKLSEELEEQGV
jgi:hypothetical protein